MTAPLTDARLEEIKARHERDTRALGNPVIALATSVAFDSAHADRNDLLAALAQCREERDLAVKVEAEVSGERPRACVVGIVRDSTGRILLGRRLRRDNGFGKWVLPGGGIQGRETFSEALKREVREECGIEIAVRDHALTYRHIDGPTNNVAVFMYADALSGDVKGGSDLETPDFFGHEEIARLDTTPATKKVLTTVWAATAALAAAREAGQAMYDILANEQCFCGPTVKCRRCKALDKWDVAQAPGQREEGT